MKKIKMLTIMAGPNGARPLGHVCPVSDAEAAMLVEANAAEIVEDLGRDNQPSSASPTAVNVERQTIVAPENATAPAQRGGKSQKPKPPKAAPATESNTETSQDDASDAPASAEQA